jgi:hypothetical protein
MTTGVIPSVRQSMSSALSAKAAATTSWSMMQHSVPTHSCSARWQSRAAVTGSQPSAAIALSVGAGREATGAKQGIAARLLCAENIQ